MSDPISEHRQLIMHLLLAFLATLGCMAAVPGDIGGCGQDPDELDAESFFASRKQINCEQCQRCSLISQSCESACDEDVAVPSEFPEGCIPLVHDGEVCLRALQAASCRTYRDYVSDTKPRVPTECEFCPLGEGNR